MLTKTDLGLVNSKRQTVLHVSVDRYAVTVLPAVIQKVTDDKLAGVLTAKDESGKMAIHIAAAAFRQNLISMLEKTAGAIGVDSNMTDSRGLTANEVMREVEDERRAAMRAKEEEKEIQRQKKNQERLEAKEKEAKSKKVEKQLEELQKLKKVQAQVEQVEAQKRAPYMLLMFVAIMILLLYLLLRVGVATGATKRATKSIEEQIGDL